MTSIMLVQSRRGSQYEHGLSPCLHGSLDALMGAGVRMGVESARFRSGRLRSISAVGSARSCTAGTDCTSTYLDALFLVVTNAAKEVRVSSGKGPDGGGEGKQDGDRARDEAREGRDVPLDL
jgi:hypothetical protein